jgi:glycosyltransferase involved in cell wall biosynthesis
MRLCNFTTTFWSYETFGGVSNTAFLIATRLIEDYDAEIFIFAPRDKNQGQKKKEDFFKMHVRRFDTIGPKMLGIFRSGGIAEKFDIVHSYHYGYFPASAGFRHAKKNKMPHFFTTAYHPHQLNIFRKTLFSLYNTMEGRNILKNSYAVLPFNKNETSQLEKISAGNYIQMPSPVNTDIFYPKRKKNKHLTIGYVGNLLPWKGAKTAFQICREIENEGHNASFAFIGQGPLENELKRNASEKFTFLKNLPIAKLAEWYNRIDILIYPSFYESFGRVLAEAITCGCAVVSTKAGAIPETVGPGGVLVDYGNWVAMKENVVKLIENKQLRACLSKNGIKYAKRYDYRKVAEDVFNLYNQSI